MFPIFERHKYFRNDAHKATADKEGKKANITRENSILGSKIIIFQGWVDDLETL